MEHNENCDTIGGIHGNSKFADIALNVNDDLQNFQTSRSQRNKQNGITLRDQEAHTDCRVFFSCSGAIEIQ